ncbi:MAG: restriction endonuclease [Sphingobacteriales bacterium]|nr:MAG: restriction endonuclease [Sphingobacteriales bacterium]
MKNKRKEKTQLSKIEYELLSIERKNELGLEFWLSHVSDSTVDEPAFDYCFPTNELRDDYILTIDKRSDYHVKIMLKNFLIPSCTLGSDESRIEHVLEKISTKNKDKKEPMTESTRRLVLYHFKISSSPPWEGITWILDLLPNDPRTAKEVLRAYFKTHFWILPDGRANGILDSLALIHAKYIENPSSKQEKLSLLGDLSFRQIECLVERLYASMDFETILTQKTRDDGKDVIATMMAIGKKSRIMIECKSHKKNIGVRYVRELLGVVEQNRVNKGVLISTSGFSDPALKFAKENDRIELIEGEKLVSMFNEEFGAVWPSRVDSLVSTSLSLHEKAI